MDVGVLHPGWLLQSLSWVALKMQGALVRRAEILFTDGDSGSLDHRSWGLGVGVGANYRKRTF